MDLAVNHWFPWSLMAYTGSCATGFWNSLSFFQNILEPYSIHSECSVNGLTLSPGNPCIQAKLTPLPLIPPWNMAPDISLQSSCQVQCI